MPDSGTGPNKCTGSSICLDFCKILGLYVVKIVPDVLLFSPLENSVSKINKLLGHNKRVGRNFPLKLIRV